MRSGCVGSCSLSVDYMFSVCFLVLPEYKSWKEGRGHKLLSLLILFICLSCLVAALNQTVMDMHRREVKDASLSADGQSTVFFKQIAIYQSTDKCKTDSYQVFLLNTVHFVHGLSGWNRRYATSVGWFPRLPLDSNTDVTLSSQLQCCSVQGKILVC